MRATAPPSIVRSVIGLATAQALGWVGSAALAVLMPRILGDAELGKFAFAFALTRLVGLGAELGSGAYVAKTIAREPERAAELTTNAAALRLPLAAIATVVALAVAVLSGSDDTTRSLVAIFALGIVVDAAFAVLAASLQGLQLMSAYARSQLLAKLAFSGGASLALLLLGGHATEVAAAWVVGQALGSAAALLSLWRAHAIWRRVNLRVWAALLTGGLPFFTWQAALLIYGQIDAVLLSLMTADNVVGWYAAAYRLITLPIYLPAVLMTVLYPALSAGTLEPDRFRVLARRAARVTLVASVPLALGLILLPDRILAFLGYPAEFEHSIPAMVLLAVGLPLVAIDMLIGTMLNASDRQRQWALTAVAAAILNPTLNVLAIQYTQRTFENGSIGAAAVTTMTEIFLLTMGLRLLPRGILGAETIGYAVRCLAAGAVMSIGVLELRDLPLPVVVVIAGVLFVLAAFAAGAIGIGDVRDIVRSLQRRAVAKAPAS